MIEPTPYLRWALRHHGKARYDLATSGIPSFGDEELGAVSGLSDGAAFGRLRAAIARVTRTAEAEVLPVLGTSQALWTAYAATLGPGDVALVERPVYQPLVVAARSVGAVVEHFDRDPARGWGFTVDDVLARVGPRTKVVAISSLHNPTGARTPDAIVRDLAAALAPRGARLIVDEVYAPFDALVDDAGLLPTSARALGANVIAVSSLTKCFGAGPHRVGWVLAPPDVIARGEDALIATTGHLPSSHAAIGVRCIEILPALATRARRLLADKRERVAAWMAARSLPWSAPAEGLFGLVQVTETPMESMIERAFEEHGVLTVPGEFFGAPGALRVAWSLDEALLDEALARLDRVIARAR